MPVYAIADIIGRNVQFTKRTFKKSRAGCEGGVEERLAESNRTKEEEP